MSAMEVYRPSEAEWESIKQRLYHLYMEQDLKLEQCQQILKEERGFAATTRMFKTRLVKWGFRKNTSRAAALAMVRGETPVQLQVPASSRRPVHSSIQRYIHRNKLGTLSGPRITQCSEEAFVNQVHEHINESFGRDVWKQWNRDQLILSSQTQQAEKSSLFSFKAGIEMGCSLYMSGDKRAAETYWKDAFKEIEQLVCGTYHDHLPNIVRTIDSLVSHGFYDLAKLVQTQITTAAKSHTHVGSNQYKIFHPFANFEVGQWHGLSQTVMMVYDRVFAERLDSDSYNSFVMVMDRLKHQLESTTQYDIDTWLPNSTRFEEQFGPSDRRVMDLLRVRLEVLYARHEYIKAKDYATLLFERANACSDDDWLQYYFMLIALYHLGRMQADSRHIAASIVDSGCIATRTLERFLSLEKSFSKEMSPGYLFRNERIWTYEVLEEIETRSQHTAGAKLWHDLRDEEERAVAAMVAWTN